MSMHSPAIKVKHHAVKVSTAKGRMRDKVRRAAQKAAKLQAEQAAQNGDSQ